MQIVNGRHKQATFASLHSTGAAAGFAGLPRELKKSTVDVEKARIHCGVLPSKTVCLHHLLPNSGRPMISQVRFLYQHRIVLYYHSTEREAKSKKKTKKRKQKKNREIEIGCGRQPPSILGIGEYSQKREEEGLQHHHSLWLLDVTVKVLWY